MRLTKHWHVFWVGVLVLLGAGLRFHSMTAPGLLWDEGWTLGLSSLSLNEIDRITALDVHPPLYYLLMKLLLPFGKDEFWLRLPSIFAGILAIPLTYAVGVRWADRRTGLWSAFAASVLPILVYYSQMARMFALCVLLVLLAAYGLLRAARQAEQGTIWYALFVVASVLALYTFYYSALALVGLGLYVLLRYRPWRPVLLASGLVGLLCLPWLLYAVPPMLSRVGIRTETAAPMTSGLWHLLGDGVFGLVFAYGSGWLAVAIMGALLALGLVQTLRRVRTLVPLVLPLIVIGLTLLGVAVGAKVHMFAARYLIAAAPFLALLAGWALARLSERAWPLAWAGALVLVISLWPTFSGYIYLKSYEVSGPFDRTAVHRYLQGKGQPGDLVFFNVLSLAGTYERYRTPRDPAWSYALTWDPVVEPLATAVEARLRPAARNYDRLWFVLYKGTSEANGPLKSWLDANFYPAFGQWEDDILFLLYVTPAPTVARTMEVRFGDSIQLASVSYTEQASATGGVSLVLNWQALARPPADYKVFVHLYDGRGKLVTQHDGHPANGSRPTTSWAAGETVEDHHGLSLPLGASGPLRLVVGLYDPASGQRLALPDGKDSLDIGIVATDKEAGK